MLAVCVVVFLILLYLYTTKNHDYWAKRSVKHDRPLPFFGNHFPNVIIKRNMTGVAVEFYNKYPTEKIVGYYRGTTPELIIRDPEIIRHILSTDFSYFYARGGMENPDKEPLLHNLFFMSGGQWKILRQHVVAAFSTSRIKAILPLIQKCAEKLQETAATMTQKNNEIDAYDLMARYTIVSIASCGFGLDLDIISTKYSNLLVAAKNVFDKSKWQRFRMVAEELYPEWKMLHNAKLVENNVTSTIVEITKRVREERGLKPSGRNDFMDVLLELGMKGQITMESPYEQNKDGKPMKVMLEMDLNCTAAQVSAFLLGGFETTATLTSFTLHQLAFNPDIQVKIQHEIDTVLIQHNGKLTYDTIGDMKLLDMAFKESLRMLPPAGTIRRLCMKKYTIPGTAVTIDPGVRILIPLQGLHMDPEVFDNPTEYRPERFAPGAETRHKYAYLPFSEGPRTCPARRLAYTQSIAGLAMILQKFSVRPASRSKPQLMMKISSYFTQVADGGVPLLLKPRIW